MLWVVMLCEAIAGTFPGDIQFIGSVEVIGDFITGLPCDLCSVVATSAEYMEPPNVAGCAAGEFSVEGYCVRLQ